MSCAAGGAAGRRAPLAPLAAPVRCASSDGRPDGSPHRDFHVTDDLAPVVHDELRRRGDHVVLRVHPSPKPLAHTANVRTAAGQVDHDRVQRVSHVLPGGTHDGRRWQQSEDRHVP
jgi:hypothetical protein